MDKLRLRPHGNYIITAPWQELYLLTKHWKSDLTFYNYEINFFIGLVDKNFIWITDKENIIQVQHLVNMLMHLSKEREIIDRNIIKHLNYLRLFLKNDYSHDQQSFRADHIDLENKLMLFAKSLRATKKDVFTISEQILSKEMPESLTDHL